MLQPARRAIDLMRDEAARVWGVPMAAAAALFALPPVVLLAAGATRVVNEPIMRRLMSEDGLAEWLQTAGFALAALFSVLAAVQLLRTSRVVPALMFGGLALGLVFIVGEELAWGQRVLQFTTPRGLAAINEKAEASVHNISSVEKYFVMGKWAIGVYGSFGFLALWWLRRGGRETPLDLYLVPLFLTPAFMLVLAMRLARLTVFREKIPLDYGEYEELLIALGLAMFTVLTWRRGLRPAAQPAWHGPHSSSSGRNSAMPT